MLRPEICLSICVLAFLTGKLVIAQPQQAGQPPLSLRSAQDSLQRQSGQFRQAGNPEMVFDCGQANYSSSPETFFSADGKYLALSDNAGSNNPSIKIIDLGSGLPVKTIRGENNYWDIRFNKSFSHFRFNRLPVSDGDTVRFEAIQSTFSDQRIFRRQVEDARSGNACEVFDRFIIVPGQDSIYIKSLQAGSSSAFSESSQTFPEHFRAFPAKGFRVSPDEKRIILLPDYFPAYLELLDPDKNQIRKIYSGGAYHIREFSFSRDGQYLVLRMEAFEGGADLVKVYAFAGDSLVYERAIPAADRNFAFFNGLQFDPERGTVTYPSGEGLTTDNIRNSSPVALLFRKPEYGGITCAMDPSTGLVTAWSKDAVKILNPATGKLISKENYPDSPGKQGSAVKPGTAGKPDELPGGYTGIRPNPAYPFLYVELPAGRYAEYETSVFDLRDKRIVRTSPVRVIAISPDGKFVYGSSGFRYVLMNEHLEIIKYINDCSPFTEDIREADGGSGVVLATDINYYCEFAKADSLAAASAYYWDLARLDRVPPVPEESATGTESMLVRRLQRNGYQISISPYPADFLSGDTVRGDTVLITSPSGSETRISLPPAFIYTVDIDTARSLVATFASVDLKDYLFIHRLDGRFVSKQLVENGSPSDLYDAGIFLGGKGDYSRFAAFLRPGIWDKEEKLTVIDLASGKPVAEERIRENDLLSSNGPESVSAPGVAHLFGFIKRSITGDTLVICSDGSAGWTQRRLIFNSHSGKLIVYFQPDEAWYESESNPLLYPSSGRLVVEDWTTGERVYEKLLENELIRNATLSGDRRYLAYAGKHGVITLTDLSSGTILADLEGHTETVTDLYFTRDGRYLVSAAMDGLVCLWSVEDLREKLKIVNFGPEGYLFISPEGYYRSSRNALRRFGYVTGNRVVDASQLDLRYNRPDKVLQAMGSADTVLINSYRRAYEKRLRKLGVDTTAFSERYSVPLTDIAGREHITYERQDRRLSLRIQAADSLYFLDRLNVWVNEVPLYGTKGISLRNRPRKSLDTTLVVTLSSGENRIEASAINAAGTESYRMPLYVRYVPADASIPKIYFAGIGIDRFREKGHDLSWSVKDIRDLVIKLREHYGSRLVIADTLFNERVTGGNVAALKQSLNKAEVDDKVLVAYSGHGLLSEDLDYYLSTFNVNFSKPEENGLPYEALENLMDGPASRQKLLLIDACHSGEVDKEEVMRQDAASAALASQGVTKGFIVHARDTTTRMGMRSSFELMQSLFTNVSKGTGATVIAAAGGTQYAQERGELRNGVFTYCILQAFDQHQALKVSDLKSIVSENVEKLTAGLQQPVSRNETITHDWQVW